MNFDLILETKEKTMEVAENPYKSRLQLKMNNLKFSIYIVTIIFLFTSANTTIAQNSKDNFAVRRGNQILMDNNFDGNADKTFYFGDGQSEDEYLVGDWNGDGKDNIAVRRGNQILLDYNYDGTADKTFSYGNGSSENEYLVGDWDGK